MIISKLIQAFKKGFMYGVDFKTAKQPKQINLAPWRHRHDYTQQCWGHALSFDHQTNRIPNRYHDDPNALAYHVCGWGPLAGQAIRDGDEILINMESRRVGVFIAENVKYFSDPRDMFSADLYAMDYLDVWDARNPLPHNVRPDGNGELVPFKSKGKP